MANYNLCPYWVCHLFRISLNLEYFRTSFPIAVYYVQQVSSLHKLVIQPVSLLYQMYMRKRFLRLEFFQRQPLTSSLFLSKFSYLLVAHLPKPRRQLGIWHTFSRDPDSKNKIQEYNILSRKPLQLTWGKRYYEILGYLCEICKERIYMTEEQRKKKMDKH